MGLRVGVWGLGVGLQFEGLRVEGLGCGDWGVRLKHYGETETMLQGGRKDWGAGCRVQGVGYRV